MIDYIKGQLAELTPAKAVIEAAGVGYELNISLSSYDTLKRAPLQGEAPSLEGRAGERLPGVFAAGDCADPHYRQAIVAAGSGAKAAIEADKYIKSL